MVTPVGSGFTFLDYFIVVTSLLLTIVIGALLSRQRCIKSNGIAVNFLTASQRLAIIPVTLSVVVSTLTPPLVIGMTAEVWLHGVQLPFFVLGFLVACIIVAGVFLPVLVRLKISSVHEYISLRFSSRALHYFISCLQIVIQVISMAAALYAACIGLHDVARIPVWLSMPVISLISLSHVLPCGLQTVVNANTFHFVIVFISLISMVSVGFWKMDFRFGSAWQQLTAFNRSATFNLDPSPSTRTSFWSVNFIFPVYWMAYMTSSPVMQPVLSLQTLFRSRASLLFSGGILFVLFVCCGFLAAIGFQHYTSQTCNPVYSGIVFTHEQILPHYVIRILKDPGLSGVYTITILICAISHCSSSQLNIAFCVWEDLLKGRFFHVSERIRTTVCRVSVLVAAILSMVISLTASLVFPSTDIFEMFIGVCGCLSGPIFGVFLVGSTLPFVGAFGVFFGGVVGLLLTIPLAVGKLFYPDPIASILPLNCSASVVENLQQATNTEISWPYSVTFLSFPFIGVSSCFLFGCLLSLLPNQRTRSINVDCLLPCVRWLRSKYTESCCGPLCVKTDEIDYNATMRASPMFQDTSHIIHKRLMLDGDKSPATHQRLITVDTETVV